MTKRLKHRCNSKTDIIAARDEGYDGCEIDLRWSLVTPQRSIVMCHDFMGSEKSLDDIVDIDLKSDFTIAFNVKDYGMAAALRLHINSLWSCRNYFVFDVPGPELEEYEESGLIYYGRASEQELQLSEHGVLLDLSSGNKDRVLEAREEFHGLPIALISETLRGRKEWDSEIIDLVECLITK